MADLELEGQRINGQGSEFLVRGQKMAPRKRANRYAAAGQKEQWTKTYFSTHVCLCQGKSFLVNTFVLFFDSRSDFIWAVKLAK